MKSKTKCRSLLLIGLVILLASSVVACGQPSESSQPKTITHLSTKQDRISFSTRAGNKTLQERLEVYSTATSESLMWGAKDDALWLKVQPEGGTFNCGVSEMTVFVNTSGLSVGRYSATISIFVPEADNNPLAIPVKLDIETPEDPAVVAAREFWESDYYKSYWDLYAYHDVENAVGAYKFPTPPSCGGRYDFGADYGQSYFQWSKDVAIKVKFEYNPETHKRPTATVHCAITYSCQYEDNNGDTWVETWVGDLDVILQVEPMPYHIDHNEWKIIDYYPHESE